MPFVIFDASISLDHRRDVIAAARALGYPMHLPAGCAVAVEVPNAMGAYRLGIRAERRRQARLKRSTTSRQRRKAKG